MLNIEIPFYADALLTKYWTHGHIINYIIGVQICNLFHFIRLKLKFMCIKTCLYLYSTNRSSKLYIYIENQYFQTVSQGIKLIKYPGGNISQNFSEIIFDFLIFQFSEKFWEIFQISSESSRLSPKITE